MPMIYHEIPFAMIKHNFDGFSLIGASIINIHYCCWMTISIPLYIHDIIIVSWLYWYYVILQL